MNTLKKYIGKYRVIAYYVYNEKNKKYIFPTSKDGVGEDDWCIPLRLTPKKDDWFSMSRLTVEDGALLVYIANPTTGKRIYSDLKNVSDIFSYDITDEEVNIVMPFSNLEKKDVMKILKPYTKGNTIRPDSPRNFPDYKIVKNYETKHTRLKKQLIEALVQKYGKNYKSNIRKVYMQYNNDTGSNIQELAEESGYLSVMDYIDVKNLYKKIMEIVNKK